MAELVQFYYLWKRTDQYAAFNSRTLSDSKRKANAVTASYVSDYSICWITVSSLRFVTVRIMLTVYDDFSTVIDLNYFSVSQCVHR